MCLRTCIASALLLAQLGLPGRAAEPAKKPTEKRVGNRWAILVGVDNYAEIEKLRYCGADMRELRNQLIAAGFPKEQVFLLDDKAEDTKYRPLKANIERQLGLVLDLVESEDLVVVGFSGHGVHLDGKSFLCPTESRLRDPSTLVSLDAVYERLQKCAAAMKLLFVDACRNDPRLEGQRSVDLSPPDAKRFAASLERPPEGILLLASCAAGQVSMEEKDFGHGVFMHYVIEGLQGKADADHNGRVSLLELYKYANRETKVHVARKYNGYQTPALKGDIADDFDLTVSTRDALVSAAIARGRANVAKEEYRKAIADFDEALKLDPANPAAYHRRGFAFSWVDYYLHAVANYNTGI